MSAPASVQQLQSWLYAQLQSLARPLQASLLQAERENTSQSLVQDAACRLDLIKLTTGALRNELWALKGELRARWATNQQVASTLTH